MPPRFLAALNVRALGPVLIALIIASLVFGVLIWLIGYCAPAEPVNKILRVLVALAFAIFIINALLSLVGMSFITF